MLPHQQRVADELDALDEKISSLSNFTLNEIYSTLTPTDQGLLMVQLRAMKMYSETLAERISRF